MTTVAAPVRARTTTRTPPARRGRADAPTVAPRAKARPGSGERTRGQQGGERTRGQQGVEQTRGQQGVEQRVERTRAGERHASHLGRLGAVLVFATIAVLVLAVVFHVMLAQRQMQLDRLNVQIAKEQRAYEQNRLMEANASSPQQIITKAQGLGLVPPAEPATYLPVPGAPLPSASAGEPSTTIDEYGKVKAELGNQQP